MPRGQDTSRHPNRRVDYATLLSAARVIRSASLTPFVSAVGNWAANNAMPYHLQEPQQIIDPEIFEGTRKAFDDHNYPFGVDKEDKDLLSNRQVDNYRPTPLGTSVPMSRDTRNREVYEQSVLAKRDLVAPSRDDSSEQLMIDWTRPSRDRLVLGSDDD